MAMLVAEEGRSNGIILNGIIIIGINPGDIEISLHWLKVSGFKGTLRIVEGEFGDTNEPLLEIDI